MITKYTIYGERCSGTNYLEDIISKNFNVEITWRYGWKHFFGHNITDKTNNLETDIKNADDVLFICIVRDIIPWINSLYKTPHHVNDEIKKDFNKFIHNEIYTPHWTRKYKKEDIVPMELLNYIEDRNFNTDKRYNNIFELRYNKIMYMTETLPKIAKNYIFIRYEDLIENFEKVINQIKEIGLEPKSNINFPLNSKDYKNNPKQKISFNKLITVDKTKIIKNNNYNSIIEKKIGY